MSRRVEAFKKISHARRRFISIMHLVPRTKEKKDRVRRKREREREREIAIDMLERSATASVYETLPCGGINSTRVNLPPPPRFLIYQLHYPPANYPFIITT